MSLFASGPGGLWPGGQPHQVGHLVGGSWVNVGLNDQREAYAIWGSRPSSVWFVGINYNGGHWDGTALTDAPVAQGATSLWGTGDDDLWMVYGDVFHVNEATNLSAHDALPSSVSSTLTALWASDDTHVWVAGTAGFIAFFDGTSWSLQVSHTTSDLMGIWGSTHSDVWAVGAAGTVVHWDGRAWSPVSVPVATNLLAVRGTDSCNVWAVGEGGVILAWRM
jgi:hypothetical protein